jgi:hypothetical protein
MTTRTVALVAALALTGLGLLMTLADVLRPSPARPMAVLAVAQKQILPYTFIGQDMVAAGDSVPVTTASQQGAWTVTSAVGKMSTALIAPGDVLTSGNVLPAETVRYVIDMGLEIVSFQAAVDKLVGGRIRPGSLVNLYGYGRDAENRPFTTLVQGRMWVVAVTAGGQGINDAARSPDPATGRLTGEDARRPATTLTVAVKPDVAYKVVNALGAQSLGPWVTLAANELVSLPGPLATAVVTPTPLTMPMPPPLEATTGPLGIEPIGWGWGQP